MQPHGQAARESVQAAAAIAGVTVWCVARGALRLGPREATLSVALIVGALLAWRYRTLARMARLVLRDDGLAIERRGRDERTIAWASIRAAGRFETDLAGVPTGVLRFASLEIEGGEPLAVANLERARFATIELPDGRRVVHVGSTDELLESLAVRAPYARIEPGPRLDPIGSSSRRVRVGTAASLVALANVALRAAHAIATTAGPQLRLALALAAGFALPVAVERVARRRGALEIARVARPSIALLAAVIGWRAHSALAGWFALGAISALLPVAQRAIATPATTPAATAYVDALVLALAALLLSRGMTVIPLAALAYLAGDRAGGELLPKRPWWRWYIVAAIALAALALHATLHQGGARPTTVLLE